MEGENRIGAADITDEKVHVFMKTWNMFGNGKISFTKAKRRLNDAVALGCPMLDDCMQCEKRTSCPLLA